MLKVIVVGILWLAASFSFASAADVGHDCAEGADEYIVADSKPVPLAGV
jgi:hypothetical protein